MTNQIRKINSRFEVSSNDFERISEHEKPFYIKRQLFRDALRVMMEEIDTLPIEIQNTTDQMTESEIYKLCFLIIGRKKLKEVERLARIGRALEKWFSRFNSIYDHEKDYPYSTVEELLEWAESEVLKK